MNYAPEKVGINKTSATLFIGVGGIGSEIITRIAEMCRDGETGNIRFVAMDTNVNDLRGVKGSKANVTLIQTSSPQTVLDYLRHDDDARLKWFPNNTTMYSKTVSEGAGQVRAISRLALNATIKTGEIQKLYKAIDSLFLKDGEELKQALRVIVVSSACGGTGSGIAMTVGMMVRKYLQKHYREKSLIVRGFLLLPGVMDTVIKTEVERESLRRNGYATVKEINAFMIKASGFCGVRKDLERFDDLHIDIPTTSSGVERLDNLPFDFCFLLDRVDQSQESMQTLDQYKDFAARSLYEQNIGPMQRDAFSMEDNIIKEVSNGDNLGRNRFGGIGASVVRYPYEDIADYIAYSRAMDRIGDGDTVGEWIKYDKKYSEARAEFKKKRATSNEPAPELSEIYIAEVNRGEKRFDNDIKRYLSNDPEKVEEETLKTVNNFLKQYENELLKEFLKMPEIKGLMITVNSLAIEKQYDSNEEDRGHAVENLAAVRSYESIVKSRAASVAKSKARSLMYDAPAITSQDVKPFHIERLLRSNDGAMHPNAMRYMLYLLKNNMDARYKKSKSRAEDAFRQLMIYSPQADNEDFFDVKARYSKEKERNFDQVCAIENMDLGLIDKISGGFNPLWNKLNELFPAYVAAVNAYRDEVIKEAAYDVARNYVAQLCAELERFFNSFEAKVVSLSRRKDEIVQKLKFNKGDSVRNVCATREQLDMLMDMCPEGSEGLLLPDKLNAQIFENIKKNAECDRLAAYDTYGSYVKTDIFDDVVLDYFRESIRRDCDEVINLNIIRAIITEQKLQAFINENSLKGPDEDIVVPVISDESRYSYLKDTVDSGRKLASPGISCANFNEPRDVPLCAYNKSLDDIREFNVKQTLESIGISPRAADSVSKYEIRFFNALYNITPDKLARFRSPEACASDGQSSDDSGIYYKAYHDYIKKIGPDSTKCATISLHIDKRWDSITEMPEISMDEHNKEMMKIHSALIYGVVHGMLRTHPSSKYDSAKRIYALEDTEGELTALIVSNETECDEFYEVLDSLYRDRASVAKIESMAKERRKYDEQANHRYNESAFMRDVMSFEVSDIHAAPTSLFEIPLAYYNSLPRAKLDDNELAIMTDSVIKVLEEEVDRYEQESDKAPFLSKLLEEQFRLFVRNFKNDAYNVGDSLRRNTDISDNRVVNIAFRKVSNKLEKLRTFNFVDKIEELRELIKS